MRLTTYDNELILKSGPHGCSVVAAPPTRSRRSSTVTCAPRRASSPAATRPLCPPPTTTTSNALPAADMKGARLTAGNGLLEVRAGDVGEACAPRLETGHPRGRVLRTLVGAPQVE